MLSIPGVPVSDRNLINFGRNFGNFPSLFQRCVCVCGSYVNRGPRFLTKINNEFFQHTCLFFIEDASLPGKPFFDRNPDGSLKKAVTSTDSSYPVDLDEFGLFETNPGGLLDALNFLDIDSTLNATQGLDPSKKIPSMGPKKYNVVC